MRIANNAKLSTCIELTHPPNSSHYLNAFSNISKKLFSLRSKIVELEEELRVVGNNLKSLEVSEEKVRTQYYHFKRKKHEKNEKKTIIHPIFVHLDNKKLALMQFENDHVFAYTNASFAAVSEEKNRVFIIINVNFTNLNKSHKYIHIYVFKTTNN